jgi:hypothetical protein
MVVATMSTEHFDFMVFGDTTEQAETFMNKAFAQHLKDCATDWTEDEAPTEYYGCTYTPVVNHAAFRDNERMKGF